MLFYCQISTLKKTLLATLSGDGAQETTNLLKGDGMRKKFRKSCARVHKIETASKLTVIIKEMRTDPYTSPTMGISFNYTRTIIWARFSGKKMWAKQYTDLTLGSRHIKEFYEKVRKFFTEKGLSEEEMNGFQDFFYPYFMNWERANEEW